MHELPGVGNQTSLLTFVSLMCFAHGRDWREVSASISSRSSCNQWASIQTHTGCLAKPAETICDEIFQKKIECLVGDLAMSAGFLPQPSDCFTESQNPAYINMTWNMALHAWPSHSDSSYKDSEAPRSN